MELGQTASPQTTLHKLLFLHERYLHSYAWENLMSPRFSKEMLPSNLTYPGDDNLTQNLKSAFATSDWIIRIGSSIGTFRGIYQKLKCFTHIGPFAAGVT